MENNNDLNTAGRNISLWVETAEDLKFEKLNNDLDTEVLIVGGGIAGLTTAYLLLKRGNKVAIAEDGFLGSGESGRTTAHLTCALDDRYYYLEDIFGKEKSALAAESHNAAVGLIEKIVSDENINCSFKRVDGHLFLHPSDKPESLQKELEATQRAGIQTRIENTMPGIRNTDMQCLVFPSQAQFHVMKYLTGLSEAIIRMGGQIFTETKVDKISSKEANANGFTITANHIVVATNTPVNDIVTMHTKQMAYRTYVIAAQVPRGELPYAQWWDTGDMNSTWVSEPYHYVRVEPFDEKYDMLISGGEDHKTGQADKEDIPEEKRYQKLESWTREHFPQMQEIRYRWSGQVMEPVDSLGFMGRNPGDENIYIITGDSGNGMTHTTIGAMIITDLINNQENRWTDLYSPARITLKTARDFVEESGNTFAQYVDWILPSDLKDAENLRPDEGGILTSGVSKLAVYRDQSNVLHAFSAFCPHLGCVVQWNNDEKSFDCPCHGSRFTCEGTVINGPSQSDLKPVKIKE